MSILHADSTARRRFAAGLERLVQMKQKKMYCSEAVYIGNNQVSVGGQVYPAAQVVDLDLWEGKTVVVSFDENKKRAYILGD